MKLYLQTLLLSCFALLLFSSFTGCFDLANRPIELTQEVQIGAYSYKLPAKWHIERQLNEKVEAYSSGKFVGIHCKIVEFEEDTLDEYIDIFEAGMGDAVEDFKIIEARTTWSTTNGIVGKKLLTNFDIDGTKFLGVYYFLPIKENKIYFFNCCVYFDFKKRYEPVFDAVAKSFTLRTNL